MMNGWEIKVSFIIQRYIEGEAQDVDDGHKTDENNYKRYKRLIQELFIGHNNSIKSSIYTICRRNK